MDEPDKLKAAGEIVLITREAQWSVDLAGEMVRQHKMEEFRMCLSAAGLRQLIKHLQSYADDMEVLEQRASLAPADAAEHREQGGSSL